MGGSTKRSQIPIPPGPLVQKTMADGELFGPIWNLDSSGKRLHNYMENHHFIAGKSTISMAIFNSYVSLPEGTRRRLNMAMIVFSCFSQ